MKNSLKCFLFRSFTGKPYYMNILPICLFYSPKNHLYISENNSFNHQTKFYFAKISKKKAEKLEKEKEKASSELPNEIDLNEYENTLKQEVENYRVNFL